jgi:hypothetical protein
LSADALQLVKGFWFVGFFFWFCVLFLLVKRSRFFDEVILLKMNGAKMKGKREREQCTRKGINLFPLVTFIISLS